MKIFRLWIYVVGRFIFIIFSKEINNEDFHALYQKAFIFKEEGNEFKINKKTIICDIKKLIDSDFKIDVCIVENGKKVYYYIGEVLDMHEIRILLDAVYSAKSLTDEERNNLIKKIKALTNKGDSEIYDSKLYVSNQLIVSESTHLKHYLDKIHKAIFNLGSRFRSNFT